ncbi:MAG: trigger factor, partial [Wolbachia pipientis]|nr:trigger factor [Wolbachia pipientis]
NNDEVAKKMGFENYSLLKDYAKKTISDHCKKMEEFLIKKELFDYLDANYNFGLPMDIVKQEQQKIKEELLSPKDDSCKEAKRRVKLAVLFMKFSTEHKISLTQNDILSVVMKRYTNKDMPFDKVVKYLNSNKQFHGLVEGQALEDKVTDYIIEKVNKREQIVSVRELKKLFNNINNI